MNHEQGIQRDSSAWLFYVKAAFLLSVGAMAAGIAMLPTVLWVKGYMGMGLLFCVGSSITLSKTLRDDHEAKKLINQIGEARAKKILKDYGADD